VGVGAPGGPPTHNSVKIAILLSRSAKPIAFSGKHCFALLSQKSHF
jgi:hypothetical protein